MNSTILCPSFHISYSTWYTACHECQLDSRTFGEHANTSYICHRRPLDPFSERGNKRLLTHRALCI